MSTVITFGEIMVRLATPGHLRFGQTSQLELTFGGGEANVAVSLANFGVEARYITRLPDNELADAAIRELRSFGVDTSYILRGGGRMGIYFLESGASQRASKVIYDRAQSSIGEIQPGLVDWEKVFKGAKWFHWTGITPALSDSAAAATAEACAEAKKAGLTVSTDLNYRKKLWSKKKAGEVMERLMENVDVCIANEEDAESVFDIKGSEVTSGTIDHARYEDVAKQLTERFGFKQVAITLRESHSASRNGWSAMLFSDGKAHFSKAYEIDIVDRVGGGDSFGAGLIFSLLRGDAPQKAVDFAVAASCLKHTISGDYNRVSLAEVETLAGGDGSGRVQR